MAAPNFLGMSDEELIAFDPSQLEAMDAQAAAETPVVTDPPVEDETLGEAAAGTDEGAGAAGAPAGEGEAADAGEAREEETPAPEAAAPVVPPASEAPAEAPKTPVVPPVEAAPAIDYKAEYERLTAPFKANGRDITVTGVDDAIALMQMGANYNKKMAALKPNLKMLKLLENHGLLSEEKLGFLIDLDKKNPEAISKLVKDSGIDPLDLSADKAGAYTPQTRTVDDREIELDTVLDEIQGSPAYTRTLDVVSKQWDAASKQTIAQSPQILKVINAHVESGIYDQIHAEIERERMFGRLSGLSDIEAYRQVGDAIQARGGFNHLGQGRSPAQGKPSAPSGVTAPKPSQVDEDKLREKRRAASAPKPAAPATSLPADFNPLALSDEEFAKVGLQKFL